MTEALDIIKTAGEQFIPQIHAKAETRGISDDLYKLIIERGEALQECNIEKIRETKENRRISGKSENREKIGESQENRRIARKFENHEKI